jgi:arabinoxylan arabinofuranohydrolase
LKIKSLIRKIRLCSSDGKCITTLIAALMVSFLFNTTIQADNFLITKFPTSDPAPSVFNYNGETRVYLYCTQDKLGSFGVYPIDTVHCYSSDDMFHWRDEGVALDEKSCQSWANKGAHQLWAPTVVYYKGKYRLFISAVDKSGTDDASARVFTATADSPKGPFIPSTSPLYLTNVSIGSIDPFCFIDTMSDGTTQAYLVVRNGKSGTAVHMAKLNDDASDVVGTPWVVKTLEADGYKEGTWLFKRNGYYYLIYATANGTVRETINYATAPVSPGGIDANTNWTTHGVLINMNSNEWTIHSGACNFKPKGVSEAKWYVFWHGVKEPEIGGDRLFNAGVGRCTGIDYITFTNSTPPLMETVKKTARGVGICLASTDSIQVDRFSSSSNCAVRTIQHPGLATAPTGYVVANIKNNGTLIYKDVDFTPSAGNQLANIAANISSTNATGSIEVRIGSSSGQLIATIPVPNTGDLNTYKTTDYVKLAAIPEAGVKDLALVFKTTADNTFQVNWIKFGEGPGTAVKKYGAVLDKSGFNIRRVNKNTFKIFCNENVSTATVSATNLHGRELFKAATIRQFAWNGILVDLNEQQLSKGIYILSIKTADQIKRVNFAY